MSAPPNTDWLVLARDAYSASSSYFDASIRSGIEADLRQFQGQHPSGSKYLAESNRGRSKLFRPKTRVAIRKNEALAAEAFFSTTEVVSVTAEDDNDPARQASAAVMQQLLQYRLTKSIPWFQLVIGAYQDAMTVGVVASYQYWEYNPAKKRDRPAIRLVPVENLRFDAGASWTDPVGTSPYVIELIPMYLKDVRARMRRKDEKTGEAKWLTLDDSVIMQSARQYGDSIRQQREGQRTDSKTQSQANNGFAIVWVHKNIVEVDEVDYCYYTLGTEQLLSKPVPLSELYFHGQRPYVVGCAVIETHKTYPSSVPRMTRDVQAEINEIANQRIDNVKLVLNKRYFAKRNRQVDLRSITRNVPGSVTLMQDTDDVKTVEFNDVTGSSYKEQEVLNLDFDDMAGAFSGSSVQANRKMNETVGGMQLLSSGANQVSGYQLRTFVESWAEPVLRQVVLLEQHYETDEVLLGLAAKSADIFQKFGVDAVTDQQLMGEFTLNVNVGLGSSNPLQQVEQFMRAMDALKSLLGDGTLLKYGLKVEEVIKELFGKLGYRDGSRFFDMENQDPMVMQLQATVQELQAALEAKMPAALLEATIKRMEAEIVSLGVKDKKEAALTVKAGVDTEFAAMQAAEVVATVPHVAPIADELMRAAGYQAPNPAGVDPNFPQPPAAPAVPGAAMAQAAMQATAPQGNTAPNTPANVPMPETAGTGARAGIETMRSDSVGVPGFEDGGMVEERNPIDGLTDIERRTLSMSQQDDAPLETGDSNFSGIITGIQENLSKNLTGVLGRDGGSNLSNNITGGQKLLSKNLTGVLGRYADGGMVNTDAYDTALTPGEESSYNAWAAQQSQRLGRDVTRDTQDYDLRGLYKGQGGFGENGHAPDTYKKPNHPTFSDQSQYHGQDGLQGGNWDQADGKDRFTPGPTNLKHYQPQELQDYFRRAEPGVLLNLPQPGFANGSSIARYAQGGLIQGPGSGTSDSIAAQAHGQPIAVSNGEYHIPPEVVAALGEDFFEKLIEQFHSAAPGDTPPAPGPNAPLDVPPGSFIIPADVVAKLGQDFFDELVTRFGAPTA